MFFRKSCRFWDKAEKKILQPDRLQTKIRRMHIVCWIRKATGKHSEYVIFIAFQLRQWLHERASLLRYT